MTRVQTQLGAFHGGDEEGRPSLGILNSLYRHYQYIHSVLSK